MPQPPGRVELEAASISELMAALAVGWRTRWLTS